jgi:hypothetical protein
MGPISLMTFTWAFASTDAGLKLSANIIIYKKHRMVCSPVEFRVPSKRKAGGLGTISTRYLPLALMWRYLRYISL